MILGCSSPKNENTKSSAPGLNKTGTEGHVENDLRKVIKDAHLRFRTQDIEQTSSFLKQSLKGFGAYISEENNFNYSNEMGYEFTIRVPAPKFDSLVDFILTKANIKELDNKSTQLKDVTEEFIDIEARIKVKKESEQKLIDLMKQAKNLSETLEIQKQLTELRADIESVEGRLKYLANQTEYSTVNVSFYEIVKYSTRFFGDFFDALKDGFQVFLHVVTLLTYLWVLIVAIFAIRWGMKQYRKLKLKG